MTFALQAVGIGVALGRGALRRQVLHGMSLGFAAGRWTCVVGPNGAGKSTLLKACAGLLPHTGQVHLLGSDMAGLSARTRAQRLAWLGQGAGVDSAADELTAYDVALLGRLPHMGFLAAPGAADHAAVCRALQDTQAWAWRDRPLGALSGGERQRVLLARLLAVEAPVMLMDEPLANLDAPHQADWIALVKALVARGRTVVSVLHEVTLALQADELVVMAPGRVAYHGAAADAAAHTALQAVFDHRLHILPLNDRWVALPV